MYTRLTKNKTNGRNGQKIDTITIHGTMSASPLLAAKNTVDYFATTKRQCSSNYVVGGDGSLGMSVQESDRSWASGGVKKVKYNGGTITGRENDFRAITIEITTNKEGKYVTDEAIKATIELITDIMKRHNKNTLIYLGDDAVENFNYELKNNEMRLTLHHWFSYTNCPGSAIMSWLEYIVDGVNKNFLNKTSNTKPALKSKTEIAKEVIRGKWGNGSERKRRLTQAGYDYLTIQSEVNRIIHRL